ncbi:antitoxin [Actinotalea ferrariae]|uniref:antitoxin n=1 Tax=Actinotalea ferrariae TaxID=1386098 RepID=UPI001C8C6B38|nr:antitoxin [Actinotalea ferrariae]MBX9245343.1 antitoxin [Actinotalea ferrariae]
MGIGDMVGKARKALDGNEDKAQDALDKAAHALKSRTDTPTDARIDQVVAKAKDVLEQEKKR